MTIEEQRLKLALAEKIQEWMDEQSGYEDWASTDVYVDPEFSSEMTDAAFAVFKCAARSQEYKEQNT